ncbi:MAG: DUF11 domain-containing protein, partial [Methanobacteriota archaeon]
MSCDTMKSNRTLEDAEQATFEEGEVEKMVDSESIPKRSYLAGRRTAVATAFFVVFIMVTASFVAILARGEYNPLVWTDKDEYCPGETVIIYGEGFARWLDVEIELSHSDFGTKLFVEKPDFYGRFVCDDYVAEWVTNNESVKVTVTQVLASETLVATTEFYDPAAYIEGFTLKPVQRYTTGDIKGYNENDAVPMIVVLNKNQLGGVDTVTVKIGVDYADLNSPTQPIYGIDYLTEPWYDSPNPAEHFPHSPYNNHDSSAEPFVPQPGDGTISSQGSEGIEYDEGTHQEIEVWSFTFHFASGVTTAVVEFGAHLALSDDIGGPSERLGASFYPGSALHVRLVELIPSADEGNRDVPIALAQLMIPPMMTLEKSCDPYEVVYGDTITFNITYSNEGQAYADCVYLWDDLPYVIDLVPDSFRMMTSDYPVWIDVSSLVEITLYGFELDIGPYRGTGPDDALDPLVTWLEFEGVVNTGEEGVYWNWVNLTYSDDHGGYYPQLTANCPFIIKGAPDIMVEKSGPVYAHVGDTITYTYDVTNTGDVDLIMVNLTDVIDGVEQDSIVTTLSVGETKTYTLDYEIETDSDPLLNCVNATGVDNYDRWVYDEACWSVDILDPMIEVTKEADKVCAKVGEEVTYTIVVTNPSDDTDLFNVTVEDSLVGILYEGDLLAGEDQQFVYSYDATNDSDPMNNTVDATGEDLLHLEVTDSADWSVDIYHPMINVTKEADKTCAEVGETVTYWINVTNPSHDTEMYFELFDSLFSQDPIATGWLSPGEVWESGPMPYEVLPDDDDPLENTAWVYAHDLQDHRVTDSASWEVDILHPMIEVTKEADKTCAEVGETVTYWINVTNPSTDTLMYAVVSDPMLGGVIWSGEVPEETTVHLAALPYVVQESDGDPLVNEVWVDAWDEQEHYVFDNATWEVDILHPGISVTKEADKTCAEVGETVTYWINITNPSDDTTMTTVVAYDDMFGGVIFSGAISPLGTIPLMFRHVVSESDPDPLINEVWVDAWDRQDHYVFDYASWEVDILHPAIVVEKWADMYCAAEGDTVTYTIVVTNPTIDTRMHYDAYDALLGGLIGSGTLEPGESHTYILPFIVPYIAPDPQTWELYNMVEVFAWDDQDHDAYAMAECWVDIYHPAIVVEKWADMYCAAEGDTVTYT